MEIETEELQQFTAKRLLGVLSTVNRDGSPQATPIWYLYDGEHFKITSHGGRVKVRNIRREPRVTLIVTDTSGYGKYLMVRGTAEIVEEGGEEFTHTMARRYKGEDAGRASAEELIEYAHSLGQPRVTIRITPQRILYDE